MKIVRFIIGLPLSVSGVLLFVLGGIVSGELSIRDAQNVLAQSFLEIYDKIK